MLVQGPIPNRWLQPCVYFASMPKLGEVKIGQVRWAGERGVRGRLLDVERHGRRREAYALLAVTATPSLETQLHAAFEPLHIGNEWFTLTEELLDTMLQIERGVFDWKTLPSPGWCVTKPYQVAASLAHWGPLPRFAA